LLTSFFITKQGGLFWFSVKILPWRNKVSTCRNALLICIFPCIRIRLGFDMKQESISRRGCFPDWKNYNDQAYSCPRDWRLSASWGNPIEGPPQTSRHYGTERFKWGPELGSHYAERCKLPRQLMWFFQSELIREEVE